MEEKVFCIGAGNSSTLMSVLRAISFKDLIDLMFFIDVNLPEVHKAQAFISMNFYI